MHASRTGFSLLEMAIVLAILGLIAGGVMMGSQLLQASKLRAVASQATGNSYAMEQFQQQYNQLPGDFALAQNQWSAAANGNGDGFITEVASANAVGETYQLWLHLKLGGYIVGNFTGKSGAGGGYASVPGENVPAGPFPQSAFWHYNWGLQLLAPTTFFPGNYVNAMVFGKAVLNDWPHGGSLTSAEAYQLDNKLDDGDPSLGQVRTLAATWMTAYGMGSCLTAAPSGDIQGTSRYTRSTGPCMIVFLQDFGKPSRI